MLSTQVPLTEEIRREAKCVVRSTNKRLFSHEFSDQDCQAKRVKKDQQQQQEPIKLASVLPLSQPCHLCLSGQGGHLSHLFKC